MSENTVEVILETAADTASDIREGLVGRREYQEGEIRAARTGLQRIFTLTNCSQSVCSPSNPTNFTVEFQFMSLIYNYQIVNNST